jgi:hypothetical protein
MNPHRRHRSADRRRRLLRPGRLGRIVILCADAVPRARHAQRRWATVQRRKDNQRAGQSLRTTGDGGRLRLQRDRDSARAAVFPDAVAGRFAAERQGRRDYVEHGHRTQRRRQERRLGAEYNATGSGYLGIFRAVEFHTYKECYSIKAISVCGLRRMVVTNFL